MSFVDSGVRHSLSGFKTESPTTIERYLISVAHCKENINKRDPWTVQSTSKSETKHRSKTPRLHPTQRRSRSRGLREKVLEGGCTRPDIRILDLDWKNHGNLDISNWASLVVVTVASVYGLKLGILLNARAPVNAVFFFCKGFWADPQRSRALLWAGYQSVECFLNQMRSVFYLLRRFCRNIHNLGIKIIPLWNPVAQTIFCLVCLVRVP